jgi:thiol-disulfide isomerase/thioredoxin
LINPSRRQSVVTMARLCSSFFPDSVMIFSPLLLSLRRWSPIVLLLACSLPVAAQEVTTLEYQSAGIREIMVPHRPHVRLLSSTRPSQLKKEPPGVPARLYTSIQVGPTDHQVTIVLIADEKDGDISRLYVDSNGNGDLTDDTPHDFVERKIDRGRVFETDALIDIPFGSGTRKAHFKFYQMETDLKGFPSMKFQINYIDDFGYTGVANIGGKKVPCVLDDAAADGNLRLTSVEDSPLLWLDLNGNGKVDRSELIAACDPFLAMDKWWKVTDLKNDGSFSIVESTPPTAEAFTAPLLDGKTVHFPGDYKGKIVLLDFWATWCGPCKAELPNVVDAYTKYHDKGLEILGISLDQADQAKALDEFLKANNMSWPQVYDGKYWESAVAQQYHVTSIPHMYLIDGDDGRILLEADALRGPGLAPSIAAALAAKGSTTRPTVSQSKP